MVSQTVVSTGPPDCVHIYLRTYQSLARVCGKGLVVHMYRCACCTCMHAVLPRMHACLTVQLHIYTVLTSKPSAHIHIRIYVVQLYLIPRLIVERTAYISLRQWRLLVQRGFSFTATPHSCYHATQLMLPCLTLQLHTRNFYRMNTHIHTCMLHLKESDSLSG